MTQDVTQEVFEVDTHYGILGPNGQPRQGIPSHVQFWRLSLPAILDRLAMKFRWRTADQLLQTLGITTHMPMSRRKQT